MDMVNMSFPCDSFILADKSSQIPNSVVIMVIGIVEIKNLPVPNSLYKNTQILELAS